MRLYEVTYFIACNVVLFVSSQFYVNHQYTILDKEQRLCTIRTFWSKTQKYIHLARSKRTFFFIVEKRMKVNKHLLLVSLHTSLFSVMHFRSNLVDIIEVSQRSGSNHQSSVKLVSDVWQYIYKKCRSRVLRSDLGEFIFL